MAHEVHGVGYECTKIGIRMKAVQFLFGGTDLSYKEFPIKLSNMKCKLMVESRKCGENAMVCEENKCEFNGKPEPSYSIWSETREVGYYCKIQPKMIEARNITSRLFNSPCLATDLSCTLGHKIVIWNETVIHKCAYSKMS